MNHKMRSIVLPSTSTIFVLATVAAVLLSTAPGAANAKSFLNSGNYLINDQNCTAGNSCNLSSSNTISGPGSSEQEGPPLVTSPSPSPSPTIHVINSCSPTATRLSMPPLLYSSNIECIKHVIMTGETAAGVRQHYTYWTAYGVEVSNLSPTDVLHLNAQAEVTNPWQFNVQVDGAFAKGSTYGDNTLDRKSVV